MKWLLVILTVLCMQPTMRAQKMHFTDSTNIWHEMQPQYNAPDPWIFYYASYSFIGQEVIDSFRYTRFTFGLVREDTVAKRVYLREASGEVLLMDYNLNVGDTFRGAYYNFTVISIDSTVINTQWHKVWYFSKVPPGGIYGRTELCVIEGIGCIQDPLYMMRNFTGCVECSQPLMYCFSNNGSAPPLSPKVTFFDNSTSCAHFPTLSVPQPPLTRVSIFPNPANESITVSSATKIGSIILADLLGRVLLDIEPDADHFCIDLSGMPKGMYFLKINSSDVSRFEKL